MDLRHLTAPFRSKRKGFRSNPEEDFTHRGKEFRSKRKDVWSKEKRRFAQRRKESNLKNEILQQRGVGVDGIGYL